MFITIFMRYTCNSDLAQYGLNVFFLYKIFIENTF